MARHKARFSSSVQHVILADAAQLSSDGRRTLPAWAAALACESFAILSFFTKNGSSCHCMPLHMQINPQHPGAAILHGASTAATAAGGHSGKATACPASAGSQA